MNGSHWQRLLRLYRRAGMAIGIFLLMMEFFDAMLTPRPDWLWFAAAGLLMFLCRPRAPVAD